MEIIFEFNDFDYSNLLKKRFLELGEGLYIKDGLNEGLIYDVLLTDKKELSLKDKTIYISSNKEDDISLYTPSSKIFENILSMVKSKDFGTNVNKNLKIYSFFSKYGGSGVTSISLTFARNLLFQNKKVLFITSGYDYFNKKEDNKDLFLEYELCENKKIELTKYIFKDQYMLSVIKLRNVFCIKELLKFNDDFECIVIDFNTYENDLVGDYIFEILDMEDSRSLIVNNSKYKVILNKNSDVYDENKVSIPFDKNSFIESESYVDISLTGIFSRNILQIIKSLENE